MSFFNQGKGGKQAAERADKYMKVSGYARGGRVKADGDTHISITIGDDTKTAAVPGAPPGGAMEDDAKKKALMSGIAAAAQMQAPPPAPPMGGGPGAPPPGVLPGGGPPMPGMKRGGRVSKARTVVGPGVKEATPPKNTTGKPVGGSVAGGASQAAKTWGPPVDNKKSGGSVGRSPLASKSGRTQMRGPTPPLVKTKKEGGAVAKKNWGGSARDGWVEPANGGGRGMNLGRAMADYQRGRRDMPEMPEGRQRAAGNWGGATTGPVTDRIGDGRMGAGAGALRGLMGGMKKRGGAAKKDGGPVTGVKTSGVIQPGFKSGGGGSAAGRLTKTADEKRSE